jgi:hypothetical protein
MKNHFLADAGMTRTTRMAMRGVLMSLAVFVSSAIATGQDEFYVAGNDVQVTFLPKTPGPPIAGLARVKRAGLRTAAGW